MKASSSRGPYIEAMAYTLPKYVPYLARLTSGTEHVMVMKLPEKIPAEPKLAMARPTIRAVELGELAHFREPSSKIESATG